MSIVSLVSGGLDSTVMAIMIRDEGIQQYPLFIDYGQRAKARELDACRRQFEKHKLPMPCTLPLRGYGAVISSGLTDRKKRLFQDAFLPGRNMLFLLTGAAYAYQVNAGGVAIGLLTDKHSIFPDQTKRFTKKAENLLSYILDRPLKITTPMMAFSKADVVKLAKSMGVSNTYSCHSGKRTPCGICVACREFKNMEG